MTKAIVLGGSRGIGKAISDSLKSIVENKIKYLSGVTTNIDGVNSNYIF